MKRKDFDETNYKEMVQRLDQGVNQLNFKEVHLTKALLTDLAARIANNPFVGHIVWGGLPQDAGAVVEQIEDKLIENNKLYKKHPTDFVHGLLSSHSYQTSKIGDKVEFIIDYKGDPHVDVKYNQYLADWRVAKVFQPEESDDYYSVLYLNDKTHHAVLAHRGTDIPNSIKDLLTLGRGNKSLKADLIEILNHNIGVQQAASYVSTKEALEITQQLGYNFSTTGHSLGAWLAELSLYFCHKDFKYDKVKAVTFDSPGSKEQLDTYEPNVHNTETKIRTNQFDMVTYLSAPNIVNVCNQHVGTVYRLAPEIKYNKYFETLKKELPIMLPQFVKDIIAGNKYYLDSLLSVSGHALSPILDVFNPETGKPCPDKYSLVLDWPHIKHMPSTSHIQTICTELVFDELPFARFTPNFLKKGAVKTISALIPNNTASSVTNVIVSFLSGDIELAQLLQTFKHFDLNTHDKGYLPKHLPSLEQFSLAYEGHYRTRSVDLSQARLLTKYKGSIDWHLSQLAKTNAGILEKGLDEISCKQLSIIKHGFKTQHINGKNHVSLINQHQHNIKSIEQFKGYFSRLIEVNPAIKSFLENRAEEQMHIEIIQSDAPRRYNEENITPDDDSMEKNDIKQIHTNNLLSAKELYSKACNYDSQGDYALALQYYQNALLQSEDALPLVKAQLLYSIACKYDQLKQTELALENYLKSLSIYNADDNHHSHIPPILYSIGAKYDELGDNKLALKYYNDALSAYQQLNSPQFSQKIAEILYSIGAKYDDNIEPQKALQYYCKSLKEFCLVKNNAKTIELLEVIERKCKELNYLELSSKFQVQDQLNILQVSQKLSLSNDTERKSRLAIKMRPILEKIGDLTKDGFWNKGFLTSYSTPFYNYGVKGYIDKNYICNQLGLNSNDEDFKIAKILCFEKICTAISENINSEKSLQCLLEFAKVYPETISAVKATMFYHPENFSNLGVLAKALHLMNENLSLAHQDTQVTFPLALILMDIPFHIDEFAEPNEIMMGEEICSEENIL